MSLTVRSGQFWAWDAACVEKLTASIAPVSAKNMRRRMRTSLDDCFFTMRGNKVVVKSLLECRFPRLADMGEHNEQDQQSGDDQEGERQGSLQEHPRIAPREQHGAA